jgi:hypothetical protein
MWTDFRDILGGCLALTCLVVGDIFAEDIPNNPESSILLSSLKSLHIFANDDDGIPHADQILLVISAPMLERLAINHVIEQDLVDVSQLQNSDRFPRLRYLSVSLPREERVSQESWILLCSVFPRITHFALRSDVHEVVWAEPLIAALGCSLADSPSSTVPLIFPELRTLSFDQISAHTAMLLCAMVSKWHVAGWPLRSLQLPIAILQDEAFNGALNNLRALIEVKEYQSDDNQIEHIENWNNGRFNFPAVVRE